jgi:hypothetical protein
VPADLLERLPHGHTAVAVQLIRRLNHTAALHCVTLRISLQQPASIQIVSTVY